MTVSVVSSVSGTFAMPAGFHVPPPACQSLAIPVANTGTAGNWLVAICGWRTPPGIQTTVAVGDDAHNASPGCNVWEPLGAPAGTSPLAGNTTVSIWVSRSPWPAQNVYVAPTGLVTAMSVLVLEITGLYPWMTPAGIITGYAGAAQALTLTVPSPAPPGTVGTLADPLDGTSLNTSLWSSFTAGGAALSFTAAGVTLEYPAASTSATNAGINSQDTLDLTESAMLMQVTAVPSAGAAFAFMAATTTTEQGTTNAVQWSFFDATLFAVFNPGSGQVNLTSFPYDPDVHAWWRIRETGGTVFWETSPDTANWTVQATLTDPFPVTSMTVSIGGGCSGNASNPGSFTWLDFNVIPALMFAVAVTDNDSVTVTGPGSAWTALPAVTATDGTDHNSDCVLKAAMLTGAASTPAAWTTSAATDIAGLAGGIAVAGAPPAATSETYPYVVLQAGFGSGAATPWDQIAWTDITSRFQTASSQRGKQYELDTIQAGTVNYALSNNDGALTQGFEGSPYDVAVYTPVRLLATWPPPPAFNARTYPVMRGVMERWPQSLTSARYQVSNAVATDVYALLTPLMQTLPRAEIIADLPYAYWTLSDPAGSPSGANLAKGNAQQIQVVESKFGAGGATADFNVSVAILAGDPGCTGWQQASVPAAGTQGWCLLYQDTLLPSVAGGVTVEGWFTLGTAQVTGQKTILIAVRNTAGVMITVYAAATTGDLSVDVRDRVTGTITTTSLNTGSILNSNSYHVALAFTQTTWTVYVDGGGIRTATGTCNLANSGWWVTFGGIADRTSTTGFANVLIAHLAVFAYLVPQSRVVTHYYAALAAMTGQDTSGPRIDRLLGDSACAYPRIMPAGTDLCTGATDISGQAVSQNVVNISESDSAWLMTDSAGYLFLQSRAAGYDLPVMWTFGELEAVPLNANTQFASGIAPWTAAGGTAAFSTVFAWGTGTASLQFTPAGTTPGPAVSSENIPVTPGVSYTVTAWVFSPQGWAGGVFPGISWFAEGGGGPVSVSDGPPGPLPPGIPVQVTVTGRAPAGAATAVMTVTVSGTPPATVLFYLGYGAIAGATEYAYLGDIATDCDPSQLYNDVTLTQLDSPVAYETELSTAAVVGAVTLNVESSTGMNANDILLLAQGTAVAELVTVASTTGNQVSISATLFAHPAGTVVTFTDSTAPGVTIAAATPASISAFGDQTLQQTAYLADTAAITDQAQWIIQTNGTPVNRISGMTLDPSANPALWPVVLGIETGQVVQVNRRLAGTELEITGQYQVMSIAHSAGPRQWQAKIGFVIYPGQVLACDDVARGIPGTGVNVLGW